MEIRAIYAIIYKMPCTIIDSGQNCLNVHVQWKLHYSENSM